MKISVKVIKEHPMTKEVFPLGFETTCEAIHTTDDRIIPGFWTDGVVPEKTKGGATIMVRKRIWVADKIIPKGTFKDVLIIGANGGTYSSTWLYNCTGKTLPEFFDKKVG